MASAPEWQLTGISDEHLATYDADTVFDQVNSYVSPHIDMDLVTVVYGDATYLSLLCKEFEDTPLVCKKNGPHGSRIREGHVYTRSPGMARTKMVTDAKEMHWLLELAAEKRARSFLETAHRVGIRVDSAQDPFAQELSGL